MKTLDDIVLDFGLVAETPLDDNGEPFNETPIADEPEG